MSDDYEFTPKGLQVLAGLEKPPRRPEAYVPVDAPLYPSEDGPGDGRIVQVTVRILIGNERSTVIVARGIHEQWLRHEVRDHGREVDGIGAAVEAALREGLTHGDNPQGLADFDPMTDDAYRAVFRRHSERHDRRDPKPTVEETEEEAD